MAPPSDMAGIADLGRRLATRLAAYEIGTSGSNSDIHGLAEDVLATAAALDELRDFLAADAARAASPPVYTRAGREAVEDLAARCAAVYATVVRAVYRASLAAKVVEGVDFGALDPRDLRPSRLVAVKASMKWELVEDAIDGCGLRLRWLKASLLLHLQVANIARLQATARAPGSFDEELASRALAVRMLACKVRAARVIVEAAERKERLALADKSDTASVVSDRDDDDDDAASWKSGKTANDSTAPSGCGGQTTAEKADAPPASEPAGPPPLPPPTSFWHQPWDGAPDAGPAEIKLRAPKRRLPAKVLRGMVGWVRGLFGRAAAAAPCLDDDDLELEAAVLRNGPFPEPLLTFEPGMLRLELGRILKKRSRRGVGGAEADTDADAADALVPRDSQLRLAVASALLRAQRKDGRARRLVAVGRLEAAPDVAVVYMAVDPAPEPVHMTDVLGRKHDMPYEACRTLQGARASIHRRFRDVDRLWPIVRDGAFEVVDEAGAVIAPEAWAATIKPGAVVEMRVSAFSDGGGAGRAGAHAPPQGRGELLTWAETWPAGPGRARPPPGGVPPGGMPPRAGPMRFPTLPVRRQGGGMPPPPPWFRVTVDVGAAGYELGFEPDFGPQLTRDGELGGNRRNLGVWVALWTNAADTDFAAGAVGVPSYDDASSICSGSSSSASVIID
ncbi:hypothetical protein LX36DRAFT_682120 [Colletotrichum falcatum]|nr:hypothetical protein LX36DRAFT_682120 [Colletotrichum falcatum]